MALNERRYDSALALYEQLEKECNDDMTAVVFRAATYLKYPDVENGL